MGETSPTRHDSGSLAMIGTWDLRWRGTWGGTCDRARREEPSDDADDALAVTGDGRGIGYEEERTGSDKIGVCISRSGALTAGTMALGSECG